MDSSFEWDEDKNEENIKKHTVSFYEAQRAFKDPNQKSMRISHTAQKKKTNHNDIVMGTFGPMRRVKNFLPKPEELVLKKPTQMISLRLDIDSIKFFKQEAKRLNTPYQSMIRTLIQQYVERAKQGLGL